MEHGKVMHMINQADFDLLQTLKKGGKGGGNADGLNPTPDSDEIRMKQYNEEFMRKEKEKKFKEDVEWGKLGDRLGKIIHPSPDTTSKVTDLPSTISEIIEILPANFRGKGRQFLSRLAREEGVTFDIKNIYLNGKPMHHNVSDIVDQLIRPRKKLSLDIDELLYHLSAVNFPKSLIGNAEALEKLTPARSFLVDEDDDVLMTTAPPPSFERTSTPKISKKRKKVSISLRESLLGDSKNSTLKENQDGRGKWYNF